MSGLVVFLSIIAALLVIVIAALLFLVLSMTRKISHTQKNIQTIQTRAHEISETVSVASSIVALGGSAAGFFKKFGKKKPSRARKSTRHE